MQGATQVFGLHEARAYIPKNQLEFAEVVQANNHIPLLHPDLVWTYLTHEVINEVVMKVESSKTKDVYEEYWMPRMDSHHMSFLKKLASEHRVNFVYVLILDRDVRKSCIARKQKWVWVMSMTTRDARLYTTVPVNPGAPRAWRSNPMVYDTTLNQHQQQNTAQLQDVLAMLQQSVH